MAIMALDGMQSRRWAAPPTTSDSIMVTSAPRAGGVGGGAVARRAPTDDHETLGHGRSGYRSLVGSPISRSPGRRLPGRSACSARARTLDVGSGGHAGSGAFALHGQPGGGHPPLQQRSASRGSPSATPAATHPVRQSPAPTVSMAVTQPAPRPTRRRRPWSPTTAPAAPRVTTIDTSPGCASSSTRPGRMASDRPRSRSSRTTVRQHHGRQPRGRLAIAQGRRRHAPRRHRSAASSVSLTTSTSRRSHCSGSMRTEGGLVHDGGGSGGPGGPQRRGDRCWRGSRLGSTTTSPGRNRTEPATVAAVWPVGAGRDHDGVGPVGGHRDEGSAGWARSP